MENKINIAELLKDCPKGMELDCILFNNPVKYESANDDGSYPISIRTEEGELFYLNKYGCLYDRFDSKCAIFPKGKTTWEGFVPPCKFKDGDILYIRTANTWICIYKEGGEKENVYHKYVATSSVTFVHDNSPLCIREHVKEIRLATKDEQQKLFDAIKENGYRWNFQAKRLEELITPIFKKGDKIRVRNGVSEPRIIDDVCDTFYTLVPIGTIDFTEQNRWELVPDKLIKPNFRVGDTIQDVDSYKVEITKVDIDEECYEYLSIIARGIGSIPFKYQNEWNLVFNKSVEPKFKVGDRIKQIGSPRCYIIKTIEFDRYVLNNNQFIRFVDEHRYELVPNKFDINTLVPLESKVLVRDWDQYEWEGEIFTRYAKSFNSCNFITLGGQSWKQCIPYNDDTKHLLGKTDDCDDFYKTWE